ncbi:family 43 glycosylhydrolase [Polaribacter sp. Z014]|uniref:family 43 glycosylhydrolase n=1 Tax=Polaribacter sp. Z014 TaxID=2927126 RepID=UPI00202087A3|nr:family 43 glycosylhydrolase [Polaribacter sp. Z014]MCL7764017.1 family 43 glycosylhydrolase [Polaribacter sp. Z014]
MKNQLIIISLSMLFLSACASKEKSSENKIPGYNSKAVSVNSIAPDRGLADPHVLIVNDTLYAMCGHDRDWNIVDFCHMDRWELWSTANLTDWKHELKILPTQTYIGDEDNCWAGDLATKDGKYYWYFSNRNFNTGVMVAPSIKGPWKDALGKPLLDKGIAKTKPYDPEIYEENGVYHIIFGVSQYYMATLGDDMISLADKPQKIIVQNEDGTRRPTGDKPATFKRGDWYYLFWGNRYSMSKNLKGPYIYKGEFIDGGHGSVFEWKGQWYSIQENHETNAFYRGVQMRPLYFNEDNTVYIPKNNFEYPLPGRIYDFKHSTQGWRSEKGTSLIRNEESAYIYGKSEVAGAIVASTPFIHTPIYLCKQVKIVVKNVSGSSSIKLALNGYDDPTRFTRVAPQKVDWNKEEWVEVPLKKTDEWQEVTIPLTQFKTGKKYLHQLALQPTPNLVNADWVLKSVIVE